MKKDKTLIIGASTNPDRYAYMAAEKLLENKQEIYLIGTKPGSIFGHEITNQCLPYPDVDTVTIYLSAKNQQPFYEYICSLAPRRVLFNPGTENKEFEELLESNGIASEEACTLVLLSTKSY